MHRTWPYFLLACGLTGAGCTRATPAPDPTPTPASASAGRTAYADPIQGFRLDPPRFPGADGTRACVAISLTGPYANGFAPNVNVTIQPVQTTLAKFTELTLAQIESSRLRVNSHRTLKVAGHDALEVDYRGTLDVMNNTKELRFLVLSVIDDDRVVALTCTALPEDFEAAEAEFRACLASFRVD